MAFNHRRADFLASKFWNFFSLLSLLRKKAAIKSKGSNVGANRLRIKVYLQDFRYLVLRYHVQFVPESAKGTCHFQ